MSAPVYHTAQMVRALTIETRHWPRYETVYGELLVTPAPRWRHQEIVGRLYIGLHTYLSSSTPFVLSLGDLFRSLTDPESS